MDNILSKLDQYIFTNAEDIANTLAEFVAVGTKVKLSPLRCREIYDEVRTCCADIFQFPLNA